MSAFTRIATCGARALALAGISALLVLPAAA